MKSSYYHEHLTIGYYLAITHHLTLIHHFVILCYATRASLFVAFAMMKFIGLILTNRVRFYTQIYSSVYAVHSYFKHSLNARSIYIPYMKQLSHLFDGDM